MLFLDAIQRRDNLSTTRYEPKRHKRMRNLYLHINPSDINHIQQTKLHIQEEDPLSGHHHAKINIYHHDHRNVWLSELIFPLSSISFLHTRWGIRILDGPEGHSKDWSMGRTPPISHLGSWAPSPTAGRDCAERQGCWGEQTLFPRHILGPPPNGT